MDAETIKFSAERLAHAVIMSLRDETRTKSWLEANEIPSHTNDRVVRLALSIVKDTLKDKHFSLEEYKSKYAKTCNR
jgi:hypothetical protein